MGLIFFLFYICSQTPKIFPKKFTRMSDFFVLDLLTNFKNKQKKFTRLSDFSKKKLQECLIFLFYICSQTPKIFPKKFTRMSDFSKKNYKNVLFFFVLYLLTNFKNKQKKFTRMSDPC